MPNATRPTIAIQQVQRILLGAQARGANTDNLLRRAGIAPALPGSPNARVTQTQYARLILTLRRAMRDELWGLCPHPLPLGSFALGCRLMLESQTLGEALCAGLRYYRLLLADFTPRLQVQGAVARMSLHTRQAPDAALAYALSAFAFLGYGLTCWLAARRVPLLSVDYVTGPQGLGRDGSLLFQAPARYSQPCTGWCLEARWLDLPVVQSRQSLREFLAQAPASLLVKYRDQSSTAERIRRILHRRLADAPPSLQDIGRQLAITPQTLRRRLREEGQSFRAIKEDLRRDAAIEYLARPGLTLTEVAGRLGFSEASTFHRAFKQWTGIAPGEYRLLQLGTKNARLEG